MSEKNKRYTVTSALPYANGPVHIGHLAGVYVPADIYVRYLRSAGKDVLFVGGSDEHGVPITLRARNEGVSPQDIVDKYHNMIKGSFEEFGISFDIYSRTSTPLHKETSSEFFLKLYNEGIFQEESSKQYFDPEAQQFLADRYITGTCPHCGFDNAYGDQCEKCGSSLSPAELINPKSMLSGASPELRETRHWYLPLDKYEGWLKEWILEGHKEWKSNVYGQCKSWLDQGLNPRAVTRDLNWGVPVPLKDGEGKVLYVWFDAPIGYISATKEWAEQKGAPEEWKSYWQDPDTQLIHFIGKDNIVFHCIIFPVMLKAHGEYILPENIPANEFMNLESSKISTSRNWAVWLHEYLEDFPGKQDVLRYVLCANAPETKDNDFTWKDFQSRNNNELVAIFGNFINRTVVLTHKYFDGEVPSPSELLPEDKEVLDSVKGYFERTGKALENYKFREALIAMMEFARAGNKYLADTEPWKVIKSDEERVRTILSVSLQIAASLSVLAEPFLPFTAEKLRKILGLTNASWNDGGSELLPPGHKINKAELLFQKIEDKEIEVQLEKLNKSREEAEKKTKTNKPAKAEITFDDFTKLDIIAATITAAEKVPKTRKLLKLTVDTGDETRTVVSGIAEYYTPEEVVGKQVSLVANLAPRKIKGIESQGMVLMAENSDRKLAFVSPERKVDEGSVIS